jgi:DNA mismatch endonuclease (patch repair protein)
LKKWVVAARSAQFAADRFATTSAGISDRPLLDARRVAEIHLRSRIMAAVKSKDTTPELIVRRLVHSLGYRFRLHVRTLPGTPDLVFARLRKIIDVRGCFWHMHNCYKCRVPSSRRGYWIAKMRRNAARDRRICRKLSRAGWQVMVIWECQINPGNTEPLGVKVLKFLRGPVNRRAGRTRKNAQSSFPC